MSGAESQEDRSWNRFKARNFAMQSARRTTRSLSQDALENHPNQNMGQKGYHLKKTEVLEEIDFALTTLAGLIGDFEAGVAVSAVEVADQLEMTEKNLRRIKKAVEEHMPA